MQAFIIAAHREEENALTKKYKKTYLMDWCFVGEAYFLSTQN